MNGYVLTGVPVANVSFPNSQSQLPLPRVTPLVGSALVDFKQHQAATRGQQKGDCQRDLKLDQSQRTYPMGKIPIVIEMRNV